MPPLSSDIGLKFDVKIPKAKFSTPEPGFTTPSLVRKVRSLGKMKQRLNSN